MTQTFLAFSLYATLPKLFAAKHPPGSFQCLNGLRFLAMAWIVLGHTYKIETLFTQAPVLGQLACSWLAVGFVLLVHAIIDQHDIVVTTMDGS